MALSNLTKVQTVGIGSNIEVVGVVTTGQFKSGTSNLHSTGVELTNLNVSGIATIGGNLSVGGVLTYEDVTNIDSIGIVTARAGVNVSGGQLDVGSNIKLGNAGVITATTFVGNLTGNPTGSGANLTNLPAANLTGTLPAISGANLTSLPAQATIANNADNRVITGGSGVNLNGEATLTYNSGTMFLSNSGGDAYLKLSRNVSVSDGTAIGTIDFCNNTGNTTNARVAAYASGGSNVGGHLYFETRDPSNSTLSERVRIKSNGYVGIGTANPQRPLSVTSGTSGITAEFNIPDNSPTGSAGLSLNIVNRTNSSYSPLSMNATVYTFGLSGVEKVRIDNNGNLCVGITGGSAKFHTKGDQGGGFIKCDAAEGTTRFFVTGNNTSACELNMYNDAGTQATIIKAGASNNSTDIHTTQAGGRFRVYVTPNSGRTYRSSIFRPFQIDEYGELRQERGSEGWTSGYYETNNGGVKYHHRHAYTGASSQNVNLIRVRRHYWGAGFYKFIVRQTYYGGSYEAHFWLNGHAANGNTSSFNLTYSNINGGNSNWIQKTATSHSSPGNNYSGWTDVFVSIPAYVYFDIRVETSLMGQHSYDINNLGNDSYALHPFS